MTKKVRENGKGVCDRRDEHDETSLSRAGVSSSLQAKRIYLFLGLSGKKKDKVNNGF